MQNHVLNDPIFKAVNERGLGEAAERSRVNDFYNRIQRQKARARGPFPKAFLDWIMIWATEEDVQKLELSFEPGMVFSDLVERSGVNWPDNRDRKYG